MLRRQARETSRILEEAVDAAFVCSCACRGAARKTPATNRTLGEGVSADNRTRSRGRDGSGRTWRTGENHHRSYPGFESREMIGPSGAVRVTVATKPVDFRKGAEGLAGLVRETMQADPFSGAIYVYPGTRPAKKSVQRMVASVRHVTASKMAGLEAEVIVCRLNQKLEGWANYFRLGQVSPAYQAIDRYAIQRLRRWLCKKHKVQGMGVSQYPDQYLPDELGLIHLSVRTRNLPWAKA